MWQVFSSRGLNTIFWLSGIVRRWLEWTNLSNFCSVLRLCGTYRRWNFVNSKLPWRIRKHVVFGILKCRQRALHEVNRCSSITERIAPVTSSATGLTDLGLSKRSVLTPRKRLFHFFTVSKVSVAVPYKELSFVQIARDLSPFRVKKRMTALCSIILLTDFRTFKILIWT
jgi:hypothetical protein